MENQDKQDEIRAKQAISPDGLEDQSTEGNSGPGAEIDAPELPHNRIEEEYANGDERAGNIPMSHPNRNMHKDEGTDKPSYS